MYVLDIHLSLQQEEGTVILWYWANTSVRPLFIFAFNYYCNHKNISYEYGLENKKYVGLS